VRSVRSTVRVPSKRKAGVAKAAFHASLEASFFASWRKSRAETMKPSGGPSATERLNALRQRIAARGAASNT